jgi:uncharacterized protein (TIGR03435 family)
MSSRRAYAATTVRVLLSLIFAVVSTPKSTAQSQSVARPSFEVVSIKPVGFEGRVTMSPQPNGLYAEAVTTRMLIRNAYRVQEFQIEGGPGWITQDRFTVEAKAAGAVGPGQLPLMMQSMLADRFKLKVHHETREMPVYSLIVEKNGHKLKPAKDPNAPPDARGFNVRDGQVQGAAVSVTQIVNVLQTLVGRPVIDKTGVSGLYDVSLQWSLEGGQPDPFDPAGAITAPPLDSSGLTIFHALQDQLGLRLNSEKGPADFIVIDSIEKPAEN